MTTQVHRNGNLHRQCQYLQVGLSKALLPYSPGILAELHRLDMSAAQVQSAHLLDDQIPQGWIAGFQEPVVGFEMLKGQIVSDVIVRVIRIARARSGEQCIDGGPVAVEHFYRALAKPSLGN